MAKESNKEKNFEKAHGEAKKAYEKQERNAEKVKEKVAKHLSKKDEPVTKLNEAEKLALEFTSKAKETAKKLEEKALKEITHKHKKHGDCILTIDAGTQSIRAIIIDLQGNLHDIVKTPIEPYFSVHPGWAEQDPEYYWEVLCETVKRCLKKTEFPMEAIKGVTLTTQRATVINVDKNDKPLRPAITWLDQREAKIENWPNAAMRQALRAAGALPVIENAIKQSEINWIRQNQPEILNKTHKFLFLSGFFTHRLTGEYVDSSANMIGYVPFDFKNFGIAKPNDFKWKMFPMNPDILPNIVQPADLLGFITKEASKKTGIPAGLPVIAAAADKACEVLGSGCMSPEIGCLSYGTTATIETTSSKYVEVMPFHPPYPSAIPGAYNTEVMVYRGFWMISWFKQQFGYEEEILGKKLHKYPEDIYDEMVSQIPPGSMGLMLQPFWSPDIENPEAKGSIIGFGDVHTKAHMYRAILEGLAYALKDGMIKTEKKNKVKIERLRVSGGGSQSKSAMQLTADIFNMTAEKPKTNETSALGAAIDAAVGLKIYPDFNTAIREMCSVGEYYEPKQANVEIYEELFTRVYQRMYGKLQQLYSEIRDITNYPAKS